MTDFYAFASNSPFLTAFLVYVTLELTFRLCNRALRTIKVALRGWPPAHLDADGDFAPCEKKEQPQ